MILLSVVTALRHQLLPLQPTDMSFVSLETVAMTQPVRRCS